MSVSRMLKSAMTVRELIEELEQFDGDARVLFACDYGDRAHTEQALPIESIDEFDEQHQLLEETAYSKSGVAIADRGDDDGPDADAEPIDAVILRCDFRR